MNGKEYEITKNNVFKFLDKIDLIPYIKEFNNENIDNLMDKLEGMCSFNDGYSKTLFDTIGVDGFVDYLTDKYKTHISEQTVTRYYISL